MLMNSRACLTLIAIAALSRSAAAEVPTIVVDGADFRPFPVAAPEVTVQGAGSPTGRNLATELTDVLRDGIAIIRSLELVPPKSYLSKADEPWTRPVYSNWGNVGASGLIRAVVEVNGDNATTRLRFYDVTAQRELLSKSYTEPAKLSRRAVYRFLDEVVELLTGEKGIFSSRISYVRETKNGKAVYVTDLTGRGTKRLTDAATISLLPAWSPDGNEILFTSYLKNNPDLYRLNLASKKLDWLSNKRGLNTGASVSPDGSRIALTLSIDGNTEIYVMDRKGGSLRRLTDKYGQDISPTWSPDGKQVAFVSSRSGNPHLYLMSSDGSDVKRLTFRGNYNQEPDWSPKPGGKIVFTARDERLQYDIFLVDPRSGEIERLTQDQGSNESPSFSPDGSQIVFTSTRGPGGRKLFVMDLDGRNQRRLGRATGVETPSWGPAVGYP